MRLLSLALTALLLAGCASSPGGGEGDRRRGKASEADRRAVAEIRSDAESLLQAQAELFWEAWTTGGPVDLEPHYATHEALLTPARRAVVRRVAAAERDEKGRRALQLLERWMAGEILARAAAESSHRLAELEASAIVSVDGEPRGWREVEPLLAAEADAGRRAAIQRSALPVLRALGEVLVEKRAALDEAARGLGYPGAHEAAAALRQLDPPAIEALANELLAATDELYGTAFGAVARRELGRELAELRRADVPRLFAGAGLRSRFHHGGPQPALAATLRGLGIEAPLRIEVGTPSGRPLAVAVAPPADVRLALPAQALDWAASFHEAGVALQAAHVAEGPFELRVLGNEATAEAFAVLFENLTGDPAWLRAHAEMTAAESVAHASGVAVRRLYATRRHAGRLLFQGAWAGGDGQKPRTLYRQVMERAYGFPLSSSDAAWYVLDQDDWLFGADALQAWVLAAQLEAHLVERHGAPWWQSEAAGRELVALWAQGNRLTPRELARALGSEGLDPGALVRQLHARLGPALVQQEPQEAPLALPPRG